MKKEYDFLGGLPKCKHGANMVVVEKLAERRPEGMRGSHATSHEVNSDLPSVLRTARPLAGGGL